MEGKAFCPAHVTGFFKACLAEDQEPIERSGSMGAGFSVKRGVTTRVKIRDASSRGKNFRISTGGFESSKTDVSEFVLNEFCKNGNFSDKFFDIEHEISVPVGYGLGSSSAVALSLSFALDRALGTGMKKESLGQIAHNAEVSCKTGLGDVLASYHGGFEVRVKPGAPGIGDVEKMHAGEISIIMICFSPISTNRFIRERLPQINGLGGEMVGKLLGSRSYDHFQEMSLEFARHVDVMTPRMQKLVSDLNENGIRCGIALFGETVFSMVPKQKEEKVLEIVQRHPGGIIIRSELDDTGARVLNN